MFSLFFLSIWNVYLHACQRLKKLEKSLSTIKKKLERLVVVTSRRCFGCHKMIHFKEQWQPPVSRLTVRQGDQMSLWKNSTKCNPTRFLVQISAPTSSLTKWAHKCGLLLLLKKLPNVKKSPNGLKFAQSGHPAFYGLSVRFQSNLRHLDFRPLIGSDRKSRLSQLACVCVRFCVSFAYAGRGSGGPVLKLQPWFSDRNIDNRLSVSNFEYRI
jgi:hypothetical protein